MACASEGGEPLGLVFLELLPLIMDMVTKFIPLLAMCKKQPPPTPPVPPALAAVGVSQESWHQANVSKYAAMESVDGDGFSNWSIKRTTNEIAKSKKIKRKAARPMAISALESGRDETVEDIAIGLQSVKREAAAMGI